MRQNPKDENDWVAYSIGNKLFKGSCGPLNLNVLIKSFRKIIIS